jgi:hypothetical protein
VTLSQSFILGILWAQSFYGRKKRAAQTDNGQEVHAVSGAFIIQWCFLFSFLGGNLTMDFAVLQLANQNWRRGFSSAKRIRDRQKPKGGKGIKRQFQINSCYSFSSFCPFLSLEGFGALCHLVDCLLLDWCVNSI